tara:strand:- start:9609 stop:10430 length:822 start_codon:yes stop_codon:yes gene_type:complete
VVTYALPEGQVQISLSGGRTSAYMLHHILEANGSLPERVQVLFANTGREMPQTIDFVQELASRWGVYVTWLEYDRVDNKVGYKVVNHNSCSMNGEPFEKLVESKQYLPNVMMRFCTEELKVRTMKRYLVNELGWKKWSSAIGIRHDEQHRCRKESKDRWVFWYPLVSAGVTKETISDFWKKQPFDLNLLNVKGSTPNSNCDFCFLKSEATLAAMAREHPDRAKWWIDLEQKTGGTFHKRRNMKTFVDFVDRQQDWIFNEESFLCQADDGECTG